MKIAISDDSQGSNAWTSVRAGMAKALQYCGHDVVVWDIYKKNAIDFFDEFEPDILLGQTYRIDRGLFKAISERPSLKVVLQASDWGDYFQTIDLNKYPILVASENEIKTVESLNKIHPIDFVWGHYHEKNIVRTHNFWRDKLGINIFGIPLAADIDNYLGSQFIPELQSDITMIGGFWGYKGEVLTKWFFPLCSSELGLNIKVFGNRPWPIPQYCGYLDGVYEKHAFKSARLCVNLSEPHNQLPGNPDINERYFKLLCGKNIVVSDYCESPATDIFTNNEVVFSKTPKEFKENCLAILNNELKIDPNNGYNTVMDKHTYFHRVADIVGCLGLDKEKNNILNIYSIIREKYKV